MTGKGRLYVVINTDLDMSAGKVAAQAAHSVARSELRDPKTVIVLGATTEQLHNLHKYLDNAHIPSYLYIDEGVNEVPPMSATSLAFGLVKDDYTPEFIEGFELYQEVQSGYIPRDMYDVLKQDRDYWHKQYLKGSERKPFWRR